MKLKYLLRFLIAAALVLSLMTACNGEDITDPGGTGGGDAGTGGGDDGPVGCCHLKGVSPWPGERDLGGIHVTRGVWWSPNTAPPTTAYAEARLAYREQMQEKHNFTFEEIKVADWGSMREIANNSIIAGTPVASIITLDSRHTMPFFRQGSAAPISELAPSVNLNDEKWNQLVVNSMTFNDIIYGFAFGYEPRSGVFFNKNVLEEAGIDPYMPYDLQLAAGASWTGPSGTTHTAWTWDAFMDMCDQTTRDIDNDGETDIYGLAAFHVDTLAAAVTSNGARYVDQDENGRFFNASGSDAFLDAANFIHELAQRGFVRPQPDGTNWDWFIQGFNEGASAFRVTEEYAKADLVDVSFEWGFVFFPKGPNVDVHISIYRENIQIIPVSFSADEIDKIMFAYDLMTEPVPGFEDDEMAWKYDAYSAYRDSRAVDETLAMMRSGVNGSLRLEPYIIGFETGDVAYNIWDFDSTPAELIEGAKLVWDTLINDVNRILFGS